MTIQLCHGSLNQKKIPPDEASPMRCNTVAIKNIKSKWPELYNKQIWPITSKQGTCRLNAFQDISPFVWEKSKKTKRN